MGKSTVLEALLIGAAPVTTDAVVQVIRRHESGGSGPRWLLWRRGEEVTTEVRVRGDLPIMRACQIRLDRSRPETETLLTLGIVDNAGARGEAMILGSENAVQIRQSLGFLPLDELKEVRLVEGYPT